MSNAYDLSAILDLEISLDLLTFAINKEKEDTAWERWIAIYPYMEMKRLEFMSFEKYKKELFEKKPKVSKKTIEDIEEEMTKVIATYESG